MKFPIPEAALTQHIAVLGKTGSGKTSTAKLIIEHVVYYGARVCVLDPIKSDWWGLTSSEDGKHAGLPFYVLGGPRGHVGLHSSAGKQIGELVGNGSLPLSILDMAEFEPGGMSRFFNDFASALLRKMRGVVYLVVEEAHEFAPKERSGIGAESMSIYWAKKLATAGRSKGIRMILATQRTQSLHNALLGSCDTMIVQRMTAPADQEPVAKWLKSNVRDPSLRTRIEQSLSSLKTGSGWLCSGEAHVLELVQFPRIETYDNTATPTKDAGLHRKPIYARRLAQVPKGLYRCRCVRRDCRQRITLRKHPLDYLRSPPRCPCGGALTVDYYRSTRREARRVGVCGCSVFRFPHRSAACL